MTHFPVAASSQQPPPQPGLGARRSQTSPDEPRAPEHSLIHSGMRPATTQRHHQTSPEHTPASAEVRYSKHPQRTCQTLKTSLFESQGRDKNIEIKSGVQGRDRGKIGSLRRTAVNEAVWQATLLL